MVTQIFDIRSEIPKADDQIQSLFDRQAAIGLSKHYMKNEMLQPPRVISLQKDRSILHDFGNSLTDTENGIMISGIAISIHHNYKESSNICDMN
jgi:hypothetical protein